MPKQPPLLPSTHPLFGSYQQLSDDPLGLFTDCMNFNERMVRVRYVYNYSVILNHPDEMHQVLVKQARKFRKDSFTQYAFAPFIGEGLTVSEGDVWKRHRKMMQPAFHMLRIREYADVMVTYTQRLLRQWQDGEVRNIEQDMVQLIAGIVSKTLFGVESFDAKSGDIQSAMDEMQDLFMERLSSPLRIPEWLPTSHNRRVKATRATLDEIVLSMVQERRKTKETKVICSRCFYYLKMKRATDYPMWKCEMKRSRSSRQATKRPPMS